MVVALHSNIAMAQNRYPAFYEAPKESYVKSMKQVFADLRTRKWDKAYKDYNKVEEKSATASSKTPGYSNTQMQALFPLPEIAMSILLSTEGAVVPSLSQDYAKAYDLLKQALAYKEETQLRAFLSDPDVNVNLEMLQDNLEKHLCQKATRENTERAYDAVIETLMPQSLRLQEMQMKREDLVYSIISKSPTQEECIRFLKKYPDAMTSHKNTIAHHLDSLRFFSLNGTVAAYEAYIKKYPNSSYANKAKEAMEDMEYKKLKNTVASYRKFLERYPSSRHSLELNRRINDMAYREAIDNGTPEAYLRYCKEFPYDLHYQEVFDSLLSRTTIRLYGMVMADQKPDCEKVLSATFYEALQKREAVEKKMIESSLIPPRRRELWMGLPRKIEVQEVLEGGYVCPFNLIEIRKIDLMSKTTATVHMHLSGPADADGEMPQTDIDLIYIFEGSSLKLDDIRLDGGSTSQKQSLAG